MTSTAALQPWHKPEEHAQPRVEMCKLIVTIMNQRKSLPADRVMDVAKLIEMRLYNSSSSFAEYQDVISLNDRVKLLVVDLLKEAKLLNGRGQGQGPGQGQGQAGETHAIVTGSSLQGSVSSSSAMDTADSPLPAAGGGHQLLQMPSEGYEDMERSDTLLDQPQLASYASAYPFNKAVSSQGCSRVFIVKVLDHLLAHVQARFSLSLFTCKHELILQWYTEVRQSLLEQRAAQHGFIEEEEIFGGCKFVDDDTSTHWCEAFQLFTWWKNNIERKRKFNLMQQEAQYSGTDERKMQRGRWYKAIIVRVEAIKACSGMTAIRNGLVVSSAAPAVAAAAVAAATARLIPAAIVAAAEKPVPAPVPAPAPAPAVVQVPRVAPVVPVKPHVVPAPAPAPAPVRPLRTAAVQPPVDQLQPMSTATQHIQHNLYLAQQAQRQQRQQAAAAAAYQASPTGFQPTAPSTSNQIYHNFVLLLYRCLSDDSLPCIHWEGSRRFTHNKQYNINAIGGTASSSNTSGSSGQEPEDPNKPAYLSPKHFLIHLSDFAIQVLPKFFPYLTLPGFEQQLRLHGICMERIVAPPTERNLKEAIRCSHRMILPTDQASANAFQHITNGAHGLHHPTMQMASKIPSGSGRRKDQLSAAASSLPSRSAMDSLKQMVLDPSQVLHAVNGADGEQPGMLPTIASATSNMHNMSLPAHSLLSSNQPVSNPMQPMIYPLSSVGSGTGATTSTSTGSNPYDLSPFLHLQSLYANMLNANLFNPQFANQMLNMQTMQSAMQQMNQHMMSQLTPYLAPYVLNAQAQAAAAPADGTAVGVSGSATDAAAGVNNFAPTPSQLYLVNALAGTGAAAGSSGSYYPYPGYTASGYPSQFHVYAKQLEGLRNMMERKGEGEGGNFFGFAPPPPRKTGAQPRNPNPSGRGRKQAQPPVQQPPRQKVSKKAAAYEQNLAAAAAAAASWDENIYSKQYKTSRRRRGEGQEPTATYTNEDDLLLYAIENNETRPRNKRAARQRTAENSDDLQQPKKRKYSRKQPIVQHALIPVFHDEDSDSDSQASINSLNETDAGTIGVVESMNVYTTDMIDLSQPRDRRIYIDMTQPDLNEDIASGMVRGVFHGKLVAYIPAPGEHVPADSHHSHSHGHGLLMEGEQESGSSRRGKYNNEYGPKSSRIGDAYQAIIPPMPSSRTRGKKNKDNDQDDLVWDPVACSEDSVEWLLQSLRADYTATHWSVDTVQEGDVYVLRYSHDDREISKTRKLTLAKYALATVVGKLGEEEDEEEESEDDDEDEQDAAERKREKQLKRAQMVRVFDGDEELDVEVSQLLPLYGLPEDLLLEHLTATNGGGEGYSLPSFEADPFQRIYNNQFVEEDEEDEERWTAKDVRVFCSAIKRYGDNVYKVWKLYFSKRRTLPQVLDFYYRLYCTFLSSNPRKAHKVFQSADRHLHHARRQRDQEDEDEEEDEEEEDEEEEEEDEEESSSADDEDTVQLSVPGDEQEDMDVDEDIASVSSDSVVSLESDGEAVEEAKAAAVAGDGAVADTAVPVVSAASPMASSEQIAAEQPAPEVLKQPPVPAEEPSASLVRGNDRAVSVQDAPTSPPAPSTSFRISLSEEHYGFMKVRPPVVPRSRLLLCNCRRPVNLNDRYLQCTAGLTCNGYLHLSCLGLTTKSDVKMRTEYADYICDQCKAHMAQQDGSVQEGPSKAHSAEPVGRRSSHGKAKDVEPNEDSHRVMQESAAADEPVADAAPAVDGVAVPAPVSAEKRKRGRPPKVRASI